MDVSFIIPLYNCLPLTQAMLASLHATLPPGVSHEIVFVDDGSTDGTREWLRTLPSPQFRIVLNPENLGYARANNRGAAIAQGKLLVLLNNDLVLSPHWLEPMLERHASRPRPGVTGNVQCNARTGAIDHSGIFVNAKGKPQHDKKPPAPRQHHKDVVAVTGACFLIASDVWTQLGGFDEGFTNGCEDVDLCLKARRAGFTNVVAARSVVRHHISASPGRKRRDEANTYRLTQRWRDELAEAGAPAWCRDYAERALNAAAGFSEPGIAAEIVAYHLGLLSTAPAAAVEGMRHAIDGELARWQRILSPGEQTTVSS